MSGASATPVRFALSCTASHQNLAALLALVERACAAHRIDQADADDMRLAVEEACVNVIEHGYLKDAPGQIRLEIRREPDRLEAIIEDDAPPFDPSGVRTPDLQAGIDERPIGGLGWHLIGQVMDEVEHLRLPGGGNRLRLMRRLRA